MKKKQMLLTMNLNIYSNNIKKTKVFSSYKQDF